MAKAWSNNALIVVLVAVVLILLLSTVGHQVNNVFSNVASPGDPRVSRSR